MKKLTANDIKAANPAVLENGTKREIFVEFFGADAVHEFNNEHSFRVFIEKLSHQLSIAYSTCTDFQNSTEICQLVADAVNE